MKIVNISMNIVRRRVRLIHFESPKFTAYSNTKKGNLIPRYPRSWRSRMSLPASLQGICNIIAGPEAGNALYRDQ
jgi:hypothetical protein